MSEFVLPRLDDLLGQSEEDHNQLLIPSDAAVWSPLDTHQLTMPQPTDSVAYSGLTGEIDTEITGGLTGDIFGFGSFESTFMSEQAAAQVKLPEGEAKSEQQTLTELVSHILAFESQSLDQSPILSFPDFSILSNFVEFGRGRVELLSHCLQWQGSIPSVSGYKLISFPLSQIDSIRLKEIDDSCYAINLNVAVTHFLQLYLHHGHALVDAVQNQMKLSHSDDSQDTPNAKLRTMIAEAEKKRDALIKKAIDEFEETKASIEAEFNKKSNTFPPTELAPSDNNAHQYDLTNEVCGVCCDSNVQLVFKPCSHHICCSCWERLQSLGSDICPWCREKIMECHSTQS